MSQPTLTVIDANKASQTIFTTNPNGQSTSNNSQPVVIANDQSAVPVTGPITDTQLRSSPVPVTGPITDTQLRATPVPVAGPITDTQLRASAVQVSVSGEVEVKNDTGNPLNVVIASSTLVDKSGTIASANVSQVVAAANSSRKGFSIQNLHATDVLWVNMLATATAGGSSIKLVAGAYYETPIGGAGVAAISVLSATAGLDFNAREW